MTETTPRLRCKKCEFSTPTMRRTKRGFSISGWKTMSDHLAEAHGEFVDLETGERVNA